MRAPYFMVAIAVLVTVIVVRTAFSVVLGTFVIQGLSLKPLLRALDLRDDDPVGREWNVARERALRAGLEILDRDQTPVAEAVRQEFVAIWEPPIVKGDDPGTARFTTPPFRRLARPFMNSAGATRSAMMLSI